MFHYFRDFKGLTFRQVIAVWVVAFLILLVGGAILQAFRPDHLLFIFVLCVIVSSALGRERARQFLKDWTPWFLFWLGYDMLRGVADQVRQINIENVYNCERFLFGWIFGGEVPPIWMQGFKQAHDGAWFIKVLDMMGGIYYGIHFFIPWILGLVLWGYRKDRKLFFRYTYAIAILNLLALLTFVLFPAAPPWYVMKHGFAQPVVEHLIAGSAGGLGKLDKMLGVHFFSKIWGELNPNRFAAVPSLHGGHSLIVAIFGVIAFHSAGKKRHLFWIYPAGMWFSAVYLNHHYVIDLLLASIYIGIGIFLTEKWIYPNWIRKYLLDRSELSPEEQALLPPEPPKPDREEAAPPTPEGS